MVESPPIPYTNEVGKPASFKLTCVDTAHKHSMEEINGVLVIRHVAATRPENGTTVWVAWTDADLSETEIEEDL